MQSGLTLVSKVTTLLIASSGWGGVGDERSWCRMQEGADQRLSVAGTPVAAGLDATGGWVGMQVQFLLDRERGADCTVLGRTIFEPGESSHQTHRHAGAEEAILIVRGHGIVVDEDREVRVGPGDVFLHRRNAWHGFRNTSTTEEVEMLWVWSGAASRDEAGYELAEAAGDSASGAKA